MSSRVHEGLGSTGKVLVRVKGLGGSGKFKEGQGGSWQTSRVWQRVGGS